MAIALQNDAKKVLNRLIETDQEGKEGYELAAKHVENLEYKSIFNQYAQQRAEFAATLRSHVPAADMSGNMLTDAAAALHRGWINIKSVVNSGDSEAILNECVRGDRAAVEAYEDALKEQTLPADVQSVLQEQHRAINEAYHRMKTLARIED
ncbi:MAG: PA2169 family four-helix-bundle protein [Catalinimonas sp.]